jgi:hypothetical protein
LKNRKEFKSQLKQPKPIIKLNGSDLSNQLKKDQSLPQLSHRSRSN